MVRFTESNSAYTLLIYTLEAAKATAAPTMAAGSTYHTAGLLKTSAAELLAGILDDKKGYLVMGGTE